MARQADDFIKEKVMDQVSREVGKGMARHDFIKEKVLPADMEMSCHG